MGLEGAESEEGRGVQLRIDMGSIVKNCTDDLSHFFISAGLGLWLGHYWKGRKLRLN